MTIEKIIARRESQRRYQTRLRTLSEATRWILAHLPAWTRSVQSIRRRKAKDKALGRARRSYAHNPAFRAARLIRRQMRGNYSQNRKRKLLSDPAYREGRNAKTREWNKSKRSTEEGRQEIRQKQKERYAKRKSFRELQALLGIDENTPMHPSVVHAIKRGQR